MPLDSLQILMKRLQDTLRQWTYRDEYRRADGSLPDGYIVSPDNLVRIYLGEILLPWPRGDPPGFFYMGL